MPIFSITPLYILLVPLVLPILIVLFRRSPNIREGITFLGGIVTVALVLSLYQTVRLGGVPECTLWEVIEGVPFKLRVDGLGMVFALVASSLWIVTALYTIGYMRGLHEHSQTRFFSFVSLAIFGTLGVAFSANLLTLYLFYEALSLATYPLVVHHQDEEARSGGRKYLAYILGTSVGLVLPAMMIVYSLTGSLDFVSGGLLSTSHTSSPLLPIVFLMFLFGFAKSGLMPFHSWLPGAMVAPTPVSSLLHAVAVVKVGVFSILRIVTGIFGVEILKGLLFTGVSVATLGAFVAVITMMYSSFTALSQDNLKRRLAFSTIGQLSYIILGALLLTSEGMTGSILHIPMHAVSKITLFFCAGAIFVASGKKYISDLDGMGRKMPVTFAAFFVGSLGVVGIPPASGFISKWYLLNGAADAKLYGFFSVYLLSSLLAASYLFPVVYRAFFFAPNPAADGASEVKEAPLCCLLPILMTSGFTLALFFYQDLFVGLIETFLGGR